MNKKDKNKVEEVDILLIQPSYSNVYGFKKDISSVLPPVNLMYLSSYLKKTGYNTKILDLEIENEKVLDSILKESKIKIFGIGGVTSLFPEVKRIAEKIKSYDKEKIIIYGGSHATAIKEEILNLSPMDFVVYGEGEETLKELLDFHYLKGQSLVKIKGICYRYKNKIIMNKPRQFINNIDTLPFPDHNAINYKKYRPSLHRAIGYPFATMITSRGCPFKCKYCGTQTIFGETIRFRSVNSIIKEIKYLKKKYKIKNIIFWDDTITLNEKRMIELCKKMEKLDIRWSCNTRPDVIDLQLLNYMKKAGCKIIFYGVESSNEKILNKLGRNIKLSLIKKTIRLTKKAGIRCTASMMIGTPFDTEKIIYKNIDYMIDLDPDFAFFSPFAPHPGTCIYEYCVKKKIIPKWKEWIKLHFEGIPLNHPTACPNLNRQKLQRLLEFAYNKFYSRRKFFEERTRKFKEDWELKILKDLRRKFKNK